MEFRLASDAPELRRCFVAGRPYGRKTRGVMIARAGLHFLQGNSAPYFSLTGDVHRIGFPQQWWEGGAIHDSLLKRFKSLSDIAALHLCDWEGVPSHAAANGFYNLAGMSPDGLGQRYHAGNSERTIQGEYRNPTPAECAQIAADHFRVELADVKALYADVVMTEGTPARKKVVEAFVTRMRPIWKVEAADVIQRHGLEVYGNSSAKAIYEERGLTL